MFCLYARTKEGPTGFMVDRHAEGLVVGKDEEKMGQRGSPTNELGLTGVRVPRENVIGIEGRGQVNALETLNVGRLGLCVSAVSMMAKIVEQTRAFVNERKLDKEEWVQQILGGMATELYATESLAYELIGRADHHGTKSVRTESAIGKYYASEALHRTIRSAEKILGIEGCTQLHELEKHRRDARVLDIYEGTNEVQRFLILRDLVDHVLPQWRKMTGTSHDDATSPMAGLMAEAKNLLARAVGRAVEAFGPQVWQNANFQPTMFRLVEIAGYIKVMDSAAWRTEWLRKNVQQSPMSVVIPSEERNLSRPAETTEIVAAHDSGVSSDSARSAQDDSLHLAMAEGSCEDFTAHAAAEITRLHTEFERDLLLLKQGLYPPDIRVAQLALQAQEGRKGEQRARPAHRVTRPLHVLVVLNVAPVLSPRPRIVNGALLETHFDFEAASRTALDRAIELKLGSDQVAVTAIAVAPRYGVELLRRALALGADEAVLIETDEPVNDPYHAARLVADHVGQKQLPCDLVLCGEPILAAVLAGNLGLAHLPGVSEFVVNADRTTATLVKPEVSLTTDEPVVLSLAESRTQLDFTVADFCEAASKPLDIIDARQIATGTKFEAHYRLPEISSVEDKFEGTPEAAAALVRKIAGIETMAKTDWRFVHRHGRTGREVEAAEA